MKKIISIAIAVFLIFGGNVANAQTRTELENRLEYLTTLVRLLQQLAQLQAQLAELQAQVNPPIQVMPEHLAPIPEPKSPVECLGNSRYKWNEKLKQCTLENGDRYDCGWQANARAVYNDDKIIIGYSCIPINRFAL